MSFRRWTMVESLDTTSSDFPAGQSSPSATVTPPAGVTDPNGANNSATDTDTLATQQGAVAIDAGGVAQALGATSGAFLAAARAKHNRFLMSPRRTGTDGFFVSVLRKA